jgi:hypothetical protein
MHDASGRWKIVNEGRRRGDTSVAVDWDGGRLCVLMNVAFMRGTDLERLPLAPRGQHVAVIVHARGWNGVYFVGYRTDWTPDDYFIHAAKLLGERGRAP